MRKIIIMLLSWLLLYWCAINVKLKGENWIVGVLLHYLKTCEKEVVMRTLCWLFSRFPAELSKHWSAPEFYLHISPAILPITSYSTLFDLIETTEDIITLIRNKKRDRTWGVEVWGNMRGRQSAIRKNLQHIRELRAMYWMKSDWLHYAKS